MLVNMSRKKYKTYTLGESVNSDRLWKNNLTTAVRIRKDTHSFALQFFLNIITYELQDSHTGMLAVLLLLLVKKYWK